MKLVTPADVKHSDDKCQMLKAQHHFFQEIHLLGQKKGISWNIVHLFTL